MAVYHRPIILNVDDTYTYGWYQWDVEVDHRSRSQGQRSRSNRQFCDKLVSTRYYEPIIEYWWYLHIWLISIRCWKKLATLFHLLNFFSWFCISWKIIFVHEIIIIFYFMIFFHEYYFIMIFDFMKYFFSWIIVHEKNSWGNISWNLMKFHEISWKNEFMNQNFSPKIISWISI